VSVLQSDQLRSVVKDCLLHWYSRAYGIPLSPWGTLIGVRPTKLVHHLFDQGMDTAAAESCLRRTYHVAAETAADLVRIADLQRPYVRRDAKKVSLYIGIPFCPSHCLYCSFPSRLIGAETAGQLQAFADAVTADLADIYRLCRQYDLQVHTIYMGGGTPTCLPEKILEQILRAVEPFLPAAEYTVEAGRPDTATVLPLLRRYGVDRISVNPQTMQQRILDALGRHHTVEDIYSMYEQAKRIGFPVVNMDFIAGLPGQTVEDMQENMKIVCQLVPENVTIHTLALKKRAPLFHNPLRQDIPSEQDTADMVHLCRASLMKQGYIPYYLYRQKYMATTFANVGYALPGKAGVYNIEMMEERQTVLAAGPGGATKFVLPDGHSLSKVYMPKEIERYVQALSDRMVQRRHLCAISYGGEDW
jgi:oxygen-independent coproporphyrinogen-3 oxidase